MKDKPIDKNKKYCPECLKRYMPEPIKVEMELEKMGSTLFSKKRAKNRKIN